MNNKKKLKIGAVIIAIVAILIVIVVSVMPRLDRARTVSTLFSGAEQYENFNRMHELFPHTTLSASPDPQPFDVVEQITLPASFAYRGAQLDTKAFLTETDTAALLVLRDGQIIHEQYRLTGGPNVTWLSMSVAKSFISALIGIAVEEGNIANITQPITDYVPELKGSAYDGVRIKDILQMSSGARWNEDYNDPESDINRFARIFALGGSLNAFAATLQGERAPGTFNQYNSTDTQVLGMLLTRATGRSITDYMQEKLWNPMGTENAAYWLADSQNMEMVFGGLNATARDYAKLGEMFRLDGMLNGKQIVPATWVRASLTMDAPHLQPGDDNPLSDFPLGYGYQWWIPEGNRGEFSAIGVYNQFIFMAPMDGVVIVKLSANSAYGTTKDGSSDREVETIELFRAIIANLL